MRHFSLFYLSLCLCVLCSCEVGWYDVWNDIWVLEPEYLSTSFLDFGDSSSSIDFHISNTGAYNEVSYSIHVDQSWLSLSSISGTVKKGDDNIIKAQLNRTLLEEGVNTGIITVSIEGKDYRIDVSATGLAILQISPGYLDFGASSASMIMTAFSTTGSNRVFYFYPQNDWISVDTDRCVLTENPQGLVDQSKNIVVSCNRAILDVGTHEGLLIIKSEKETFKSEYRIVVTIPEQGIQSQQVGDYIFSVKRTPYRNSDGSVSVELSIENASSMYRTFSLASSTSRAYDDDGKDYRIAARPVNIMKKATEVMILNIQDVPLTINSFSSISLDFSLSQLVVFGSLSF